MSLPIRFKPSPGPDDFLVFRERGYTWVDKTPFIAEILEHPDQVILLPRPRRFGKSLNLSALRYYVERSDSSRAHLYEGLAIERASAEVRAHQGRHPVVFLSLKGARHERWEDCWSTMELLLAQAVGDHPELRDSTALHDDDRALFTELSGRKASPGQYALALALLTRWLHAHHGEPAILLIDEYDAPIEAGFAHGFYREVVGFLRNLLGEVFKTNPHLYKGVLTGVRRVSKESLFSGLNNVRVHSILDPHFATTFGFTEHEVAWVLQQAGRADAIDEVRRWYDGYRFGGHVIYNPWSVLCFAQEGIIKEHWVSTSSEEVLRELIPHNRAGLAGPFETLLHGGTVEVEIDEHVVFRDLIEAPDAIWSFLLTAGYLRADETRWEEGRARVKVAIPNREVFGVWRRQFHHWLTLGMGGAGEDVRVLLDAILAGDARVVQRMLRTLVRNQLSFHDTPGIPSDPERVYQAFVLGLLAWLEPAYRVRSNRESGHGRADVLLFPSEPGKPGVVMELKRVWSDEGETVDAALEAALSQIERKGYTAELEAVGARPIHKVAVVFAGKEVWVR